MSEQLFRKIFGQKKLLLAMVHLKGKTDEETLNRAKREIDIYYEEGVDAVIVENYFGNYYQMRDALHYLNECYPNKIYGVNSLNFDTLGFDLAIEFGASFVQLDSVVGHVKPRDEASLEVLIAQQRKREKIAVLGGVRFKYQPILSENSLKMDLQISKRRCDAVVVSGEATGSEPSLNKIMEYRQLLGNDFPLIVGSGITADNVTRQLEHADGAIVGSYFKDNYKDEGEVSAEHVRKLVSVFKTLK